jgi:hypothetical protein
MVQIYNEMLHTHKKMNEILSFAIIWVELEIIMLSEICQAQKDVYHMISFIYIYIYTYIYILSKKVES